MEVTFWDRVQELMRIHGMTQMDLGKTLDLSPSFLSTAIARNSSPRADVALKVAKQFGVTVEWLLTGLDEHSVEAKFAPAIKDDRIMEIAYHLQRCPDEFIEIIGQLIRHVEANRAR